MMKSSLISVSKQVLLIGGGHTHLICAPSIAAGLGGDRIILVAPAEQLLYSGMMPGWLAGQYQFEECAIPLARICERAGIRWIQDRVVSIDFDARSALGASGDRYPYDIVSINVGSANDLTPGLTETQADVGASPAKAGQQMLLGAKPFAEFVFDWGRWRERREPVVSSAVIGGGAAAVEIALAMANSRLSRIPVSSVDLYTRGSGLLVSLPKRAGELAWRALKKAGVRVHMQMSYQGPSPQGVFLIDRDGQQIDTHHGLVIVATGAKPPQWLVDSAREQDVSLAEDGGIAVDGHCQSLSHQDVFASGDCATFVDIDVPKSGLYALRQAPTLAAAVQAKASGQAMPSKFNPKRLGLVILNQCDGSAIAAWGRFVFSGKWVWHWKDRIDRRFMARFQAPVER